MSDFFTKKQKKFWCETCKIFIEYTKRCIDIHQRSKNHLRMVNKDLEYKHQKSKFQKINNQNNILNNSENNANNINELVSTKLDPLNSYKNQNLLNKKTERNNLPDNKRNNFNNNNHVSNNIGLNALLLEEIKKEKIKSEITSNRNEKKLNYNSNSNNYDNENQINNNIWSIFWDNNYKLHFYYNNITKISQWEKPIDFNNTHSNRNYIELDNSNSVYQNNKNTEKDEEEDSDDIEEKESSGLDELEEEEKEKQGLIGKWEVVEVKSKINLYKV